MYDTRKKVVIRVMAIRKVISVVRNDEGDDEGDELRVVNLSRPLMILGRVKM